jgi:hypothetical protein
LFKKGASQCVWGNAGCVEALSGQASNQQENAGSRQQQPSSEGNNQAATNESNPAPTAVFPQARSNLPIGMILGVSGSAVVVIAAIALVLFKRRRAGNESKPSAPPSKFHPKKKASTFFSSLYEPKQASKPTEQENRSHIMYGPKSALDKGYLQQVSSTYRFPETSGSIGWDPYNEMKGPAPSEAQLPSSEFSRSAVPPFVMSSSRTDASSVMEGTAKQDFVWPETARFTMVSMADTDRELSDNEDGMGSISRRSAIGSGSRFSGFIDETQNRSEFSRTKQFRTSSNLPPWRSNSRS